MWTLLTYMMQSLILSGKFQSTITITITIRTRVLHLYETSKRKLVLVTLMTLLSAGIIAPVL